MASAHIFTIPNEFAFVFTQLSVTRQSDEEERTNNNDDEIFKNKYRTLHHFLVASTLGLVESYSFIFAMIAAAVVCTLDDMSSATLAPNGLYCVELGNSN